MERAIFVSKTRAALAVIASAKRAGIQNEDIAKHGKTFPVYRRGQMLGYSGMYPVQIEPYVIRNPVMEETV